MLSVDADAREGLEGARQLQRKGELKAAEETCRGLLSAEGEDRRAVAALLALVLLLLEKRDEGLELLESAGSVEAETAAWASDLGFALILAERPDDALAALERAGSLPGADAVAYNRLAVIRLGRGDLNGAEEALREAILRDPDWAEAHSNLGGVMVRLEKLEDALIHYERALLLNPSLEVAKEGRNAVLIALDRTDEAVERITQELDDDPESVPARCRLARVFVIAEKFQEAEDRLREAMTLAPEDVSIPLELAALLCRQERYPAAHKLLADAKDKEPECLPVLAARARVQIELGLPDAAEKTLDKAMDLDPETPAVRLIRAELSASREDHAAAEAELREILELYPGSPEALGALGHTLMWTGHIDEAVTCFEQAAAINPMAFASLIQARKFPEDPAILERMVQFARSVIIPGEARLAMCFALAQLYEKRGEFESAFAFAEMGNNMVAKLIDHDPDHYRRLVDLMIEIFTPAFFAARKGGGIASQRPVFVCGMPRSGTTLAEQVLSSHPRVFGAGELPIMPAITRLSPIVLKTRKPYPACMPLYTARTAEQAAHYYLDRIAQYDGEALRVVDKLPFNFLHLGLIALMFPSAKIIHLVRDPRDVAVSNYFTNFKHRRGLGYSFDLGAIGHMLNGHERLMAHWREVLPVPVFDLEYETLVDDFEATARRMLAFIGLDWDNRVLDFHHTERPVKTASVWQVRQPMYKSSKGRWRRYENFLDPLLDILNGSP